MKPFNPYGIVGAAIVPHAPQFLSLPESEDLEQVARVRRSLEAIGERLRALEPDCIVMVSNDHGDHFVTHGVPPFCVHVADEADGMHRHRGMWAIDGATGYALVPEMERAGFDLAFTMNARLQTAFTIPYEFMGFGRDVPLVALFVNAYVPPQPSGRRCYAFGAALQTALQRLGKRALLIASGGLSHYPGTVHYPHPDLETDQRIFAEIQAGHLTHLLSYDDWELDRTGNVELRAPLILAGALGENRPPFTALLEPSWHHIYASAGWDLTEPAPARDPLRYPAMPPERARLAEAVLALRTRAEAAERFLDDPAGFCQPFQLADDEREALCAMQWEVLRDRFSIHALLTSGAAMQIGLATKRRQAG